MNLLLFSNSTNAGENYLSWTLPYLKDFISRKNLKKCLFFPYAGVTVTWDDYTKKVADVFSQFGCEIIGVHTQNNIKEAINQCDAIVVGGGSTFRLVQTMQDNGSLELIRQKALEGMPYIGWSAGSNITCPTLCTTNDMPIIEPKSFRTLNLIPFQINPHYLDANPEGHGGETREQRILEFLELNQEVTVVGLREATALSLENNNLKLIGKRNMRIFKYGIEPMEVDNATDINYLMQLNA